MSITISFTEESPAELKERMRDFLAYGEPVVVQPIIQGEAAAAAPIEQPATAKRGRKPKAVAPETGSAPQPTQAVPVDATSVSAPVAAAPTSPLGPDAVAPGGAVFLAVKAFNDKHGMEKARELLAKFGAGMVRQIKPSDYEAVIAACAA